ncbi:hypothetical protein EE612_017102 [Oryza sativa]|nr:hypothetical protein EE612_017102 [Oryza sativa]
MVRMRWPPASSPLPARARALHAGSAIHIPRAAPCHVETASGHNPPRRAPPPGLVSFGLVCFPLLRSDADPSPWLAAECVTLHRTGWPPCQPCTCSGYFWLRPPGALSLAACSCTPNCVTTRPPGTWFSVAANITKYHVVGWWI